MMGAVRDKCQCIELTINLEDIMSETWYAVRGVLTKKQLDLLPPQVYAELQVYDPATGQWSDYGTETAEGLVAKNPPFDEMAVGRIG